MRFHMEKLKQAIQEKKGKLDFIYQANFRPDSQRELLLAFLENPEDYHAYDHVLDQMRWSVALFQALKKEAYRIRWGHA